MAGTLTLCGTPIGNLQDLSERVRDTLASADLIFAEDTRRTAKLLSHLGVSVPMKSFFAGNEKGRLDLLRKELDAGASVVLVSDAGMPVVSDPGASAVAVAVEVGALVCVVPGPSAVVTALAVSGFDGDRFVFDGFLPRKGSERTRALERIGEEQRTTVLFAAPSRVASDLADLAVVSNPERRVVVTRELTKMYEEIWRGTLLEAADHWGTDGTTKGEFTLVVEGAPERDVSIGDAADAVRALIAQGSSTSDAVRTIATDFGVRRRELYELILDGDA
jgi:16S rRNA (cytidine1402-2'-O)-methyltransferase